MGSVSAEVAKKNLKSSFLSCEKDTAAIWNLLLVKNRPYSDRLKRLLVIPEPDCLDESKYLYEDYIKDYSLSKLKNDGYLRITPKLNIEQFDDIKAYILLEYDAFIQSSNPNYRDVDITFTIMCHLDCWEMDDWKIRPLLIAGYIDGILNGAKLSGIGELQFIGASQTVLNEYLGAVVLKYAAVHGIDDKIEPSE